jgi:hypothetical protein
MLCELELGKIKYSMRTRIIAVTELTFIFPPALFMTALLLRNLLPLQHEPTRSAQQLIMWYAGVNVDSLGAAACPTAYRPDHRFRLIGRPLE